MNERIALMINDLSFQNKKIIIFGVGGVGGTAFEALVRSGIKQIDIYDFDQVEESNLNRQVISKASAIGLNKVDVAKAFALEINPEIIVNAHHLKVTKDNIQDLKLTDASFIIDAIDDIEAKIAIIKYAHDHNINIISSMGTGNKLDPTRLEISDITKTSYCPLARIVRKRLREEKINHLTVVYSKEQRESLNHLVGTMMFVPSSAGLLIASYVIRRLIGEI